MKPLALLVALLVVGVAVVGIVAPAPARAAVVSGCTTNPSGSKTWTNGTFGQDGYQEVTSYTDGTIAVWEIGTGYYAEGWDSNNQIGHFFLDDNDSDGMTDWEGGGSYQAGYHVDSHFNWANSVWYNAFQSGCVP